MQQRQFRPGDVLDDYCPRERRVTDHAVVAMVDGQIQRTRCVVCEAEHEYKNARLPTLRKKETTAALYSQVLDNLEASPGRGAVEATGAGGIPPGSGPAAPADAMPASGEPAGGEAAEGETAAPQEDRPFRRSLIRAQLPRPEGQAPPARAIPEFTMHQPQNLRPRRGQRFHRPPGAGGAEFGGPMRSGRHGGGNPQGNSAGPGAGQGGRRRRRKKH